MVTNTPDRRAPLYLTWTITYRCNVACEHCDWPLTRTTMGEELSDVERNRIADEIADLPCMAVTFTGGEPLILDNLFEWIGRAGHKKNKMVNLVTNGWLLRKHADALMDLDLSSITVSMDSHIAEEHDQFRHRKGLFERALEGIDYIRKNRRKGRPKILLRGTITPQNIDQLGDYIRFFGKRVDHIGFQPAFDSQGHSIRSQGVLFTEADRQHFSDQLYRVMKEFPFMDTLYYRSVAKYFLDRDQLKQDHAFRCLFWSNFVAILEPWGDVYPCLRFTQKPGVLNVRDHTLREIWKSEEMQALKKTMCDPKEQCNCWGYNQCVSLYLTKLNRGLPMCGARY
ncbi:MAG: radical SAM protein [Planctomycetota bacterium]